MPTTELPDQVYLIIELYDKNAVRYEPNACKLTTKIYSFEEGVEKCAEMTDAMVYSVKDNENMLISIEQSNQVIHVRASDVRFVTVHYVPKAK